MASAVVDLLNEAAGEFVEGLDKSQVDFSSILTGKVQLRHLQIKPAVFDALQLPFRLEFNYVGLVQLDLPLYALATSPLEAELKDVLLVLSVVASKDWDKDAFEAQYRKQKAEALASGEYKALFSTLEKGILWQLLLKLVGNFTAKVSNIHIRIEDFCSLTGKPFALGVCLRKVELHAAPRGADFSEPGVCRNNGSPTDDTFYKVISLDGLGIYLDDLLPPLPLKTVSVQSRRLRARRSRTRRATFGGPGHRSESASVSSKESDRERAFFQEEQRLPSAGAGSSGGFGGGSYNDSVRDFYQDVMAQLLQAELARAAAAADTNPDVPSSSTRVSEDLRRFLRPSNWGSPKPGGNWQTPLLSAEGVACSGGLTSCCSPCLNPQPQGRRQCEPLSLDDLDPSADTGGHPASRGLSGNVSAQDAATALSGGDVSCQPENLRSLLREASWVPVLAGFVKHPPCAAEESTGERSNSERASSERDRDAKRAPPLPLKVVGFESPSLESLREIQEGRQLSSSVSLGGTRRSAMDSRDLSSEGVKGAASHDGGFGEAREGAAGEEDGQPHLEERALDREKLANFRRLLETLWEVPHEFVLSPELFQGQAKVFLALVPTVPADDPLERCWSPWGTRHKRASETHSASLPACTVFVTLPQLRLTLSASQLLQGWKWFEYAFVLRGAWQSGILGSSERARATPADTRRYLLCWPIHLLRCQSPLAVLRDAGLLFASTQDAELATRETTAAAAEDGRLEDEDDLDDEDAREQELEGLDSLEAVDAFCAQFEETHSLQAVYVLRAKALERLVRLRELQSSREEKKGVFGRAWQWLSCRGGFSSRTSADLRSARGDPQSLAAASVQLVEGFFEQNGMSLSRLSQVREHFFSADLALDVALTEVQILLSFEGSGVAVPTPRRGQRVLALESQCLHCHVQVSNTGDQTLSLDAEVYATTLLSVARDLESVFTPPEVGVLFLLEPSQRRAERKHKTNVLMEVLHKVFASTKAGGAEGAEGEASQGPDGSSPAPRGGGQGAGNARAPSANDTAAAAQPTSTNALMASFLASGTRGGGVLPSQQSDFRKRLAPIRDFEPGLYVHMDSQLFRTLRKPDMRVLLHSCANLLVLLSPQRALLVLGECLGLVDAARTKELLLSSNIQTAALLRQGEAFCSAVASGDIAHPNLELEVDLEKTVSVIVPRVGSRLDCEGVVLDLGKLRAKSRLQPRRLTYPKSLPVDLLTDTYSCDEELLRLQIFLGGLVMPFPEKLSRVLELSAAAAAAVTGSAQKEKPSDPTAASRNPPSKAASECTGSYLVSPVSESALSLRVAHEKSRADVPAFHVDVVQQRVRVSLSAYDFEFLCNVAAESLEIFYAYAPRLTAMLEEAQAVEKSLDARLTRRAKEAALAKAERKASDSVIQTQTLEEKADASPPSQRSRAEATGGDREESTEVLSLVRAELAESRAKAREALVAASESLLTAQRGAVVFEAHFVVAGCELSLLRTGPPSFSPSLSGTFSQTEASGPDSAAVATREGGGEGTAAARSSAGGSRRRWARRSSDPFEGGSRGGASSLGGMAAPSVSAAGETSAGRGFFRSCAAPPPGLPAWRLRECWPLTRLRLNEAYRAFQTVGPLVTLHVGDASLAVRSSTDGLCFVDAALAGLEIRDDTNAAPLSLSALYLGAGAQQTPASMNATTALLATDSSSEQEEPSAAAAAAARRARPRLSKKVFTRSRDAAVSEALAEARLQHELARRSTQLLETARNSVLTPIQADSAGSGVFSEGSLRGLLCPLLKCRPSLPHMQLRLTYSATEGLAQCGLALERARLILAWEVFDEVLRGVAQLLETLPQLPTPPSDTPVSAASMARRLASLSTGSEASFPANKASASSAREDIASIVAGLLAARQKHKEGKSTTAAEREASPTRGCASPVKDLDLREGREARSLKTAAVSCSFRALRFEEQGASADGEEVKDAETQEATTPPEPGAGEEARELNLRALSGSPHLFSQSKTEAPSVSASNGPSSPALPDSRSHRRSSSAASSSLLDSARLVKAINEAQLLEAARAAREGENAGQTANPTEDEAQEAAASEGFTPLDSFSEELLSDDDFQTQKPPTFNLPSSAWSRAETLDAVAAAGRLEAFAARRKFPRLQLTVRLKRLEVWLPAEPLRLPLPPGTDSLLGVASGTTRTARGVSAFQQRTSFHERRAAQEAAGGAGLAGGLLGGLDFSRVKEPTVAVATALGGAAQRLGGRGVQLAQRLRVDAIPAGLEAVEERALFLKRRLRSGAVQQTPAAAESSSATSFAPEVSSADLGISGGRGGGSSAAASRRRSLWLQRTARSVSPMPSDRHGALAHSNTLGGRRGKLHGGGGRDLWKALRRVVLEKHRRTREGAAVLSQFAERVPRVIAFSAGTEVNLTFALLENTGTRGDVAAGEAQLPESGRVEKSVVGNNSASVVELRDVCAILERRLSPLQALEPLCPSVVRFSLSVTELCAAAVQPELLSPLLPCAVDWRAVKASGSSFIAPTRAQLSVALCLPSFFSLNERLLGVDRETSRALHMQYGCLHREEAEGLALTCEVEPMVLALDSYSVVFLYQALSIMTALAANAQELFAPAVPVGSSYGEEEDAFREEAASSGPVAVFAAKAGEAPRLRGAPSAAGQSALTFRLSFDDSLKAEEAATGAAAAARGGGGSEENPNLSTFMAQERKNAPSQPLPAALQRASLTGCVVSTPQRETRFASNLLDQASPDASSSAAGDVEEEEMPWIPPTPQMVACLMHALPAAVSAKAELIRVSLWDGFSVSKKCCFTAHAEDLRICVVSRAFSVAPPETEGVETTLAASREPLVLRCGREVEALELEARHRRLRANYEKSRRAYRRPARAKPGRGGEEGGRSPWRRRRREGAPTAFGSRDNRGPAHKRVTIETYQVLREQVRSQIRRHFTLFPGAVSAVQKEAQHHQEKQEPEEEAEASQAGGLTPGDSFDEEFRASHCHSLERMRSGPNSKASAADEEERLLFSPTGSERESSGASEESRGVLLQGVTGSASRLAASGGVLRSTAGEEEARSAISSFEGYLPEAARGVPRLPRAAASLASSEGDFANKSICAHVWASALKKTAEEEEALHSQQRSLLRSSPASPSALGRGGPGGFPGVEGNAAGGGGASSGSLVGARTPSSDHRRASGVLISPSTPPLTDPGGGGLSAAEPARASRVFTVRFRRRVFALPALTRRDVQRFLWGSSAASGAGASRTAMGRGSPDGREGPAFGGVADAETTRAVVALRRSALSRRPWLTLEGSAMISLEHLNRLEGCVDASVEPWRLVAVGSKAALDAPTCLDVEASWLNLNLNVALADAALVFGYSLIAVVVRERAQLQLSTHRRVPPASVKAATSGGSSSAFFEEARLVPQRGSGSASSYVPRHSRWRQQQGRQAEASEMRSAGVRDGGDSQREGLPSETDLVVEGSRSVLPSAVLLPNGALLGSGGFDALSCLEKALSLEFLGDNLLAKTSSELLPAAEFAGDHLKASARTKTTSAEAQVQPREGTGGQEAPRAEELSDATPLLYNLLGQPLALMFDMHVEENAEVLSGRWLHLEDGSSCPLPTDENNVVLPFLVRLRLLNYVFDIPSQLFCFTAETRDVVRLSVPEHPLPPNIHLQKLFGQGSSADGSSHSRRRSRLRSRRASAPDSRGGLRSFGFGAAAKSLKKRGHWDPTALPRPRTSIYVLWRSSATANAAGSPRHDVFLSSCLSLRNNTDERLAVFPTIPGPWNEKRSVFAAFRSKFLVQPSRPPTESMPPFASALKRHHQLERRVRRRGKTVAGGGASQIVALPPVLKLPAMEHYIVEDPTSADIGRKFSLIAENPSSDEEEGRDGVTVLQAKAAANAFASLAGRRQTRSRNSPPQDASPASAHPAPQTKVQFAPQPVSAQGSSGSDGRDAGQGRTTAEGGSQTAVVGGLNSEDKKRNPLRGRGARRRRRLTEGGPASPVGPKAQALREKVALRLGVDFVVLEPGGGQVTPLPLFWTLAENAPLWVCLAERAPKYRHRLNRFVADPRNADFLAEEASLRGICGSLLAKYKPRRSTISPRLVHIEGRLAFSAAVVGVGLRVASEGKETSVAGLFFEVVIEDCLVVCNRLPRPLVLRLLDSESARAQSQSQSQAGVVSTQHTAAALQPRASDVVIEAGGEVSLPADPSRVCVVFGQHVSRPISVAYQMQGTSVQRVYLDGVSSAKPQRRMWGEASFEGLTPGGLGSASSRDDETGTFGSHSLSGDFSSPESYPNKGERSKQEAATGLPPDPSTLWLWAETSDKARQAHAGKGAAATSLKFLHGTFVRSLTLFADAWVINRTGYCLVLKRLDNGALQPLPPFRRVVLSHDFASARLAVGLPASQASSVWNFYRYPLEEPQGLDRCMRRLRLRKQRDSTVWSGEFMLSDMGVFRVCVDRSEVNPTLHYSLSMTLAPSPFFRTTVVELLPAFLLSNETRRPLWVCESGGAMGAAKDAPCCFHLLEPGALREFHPQTKHPPAIHLTALPPKTPGAHAASLGIPTAEDRTAPPPSLSAASRAETFRCIPSSSASPSPAAASPSSLRRSRSLDTSGEGAGNSFERRDQSLPQERRVLLSSVGEHSSPPCEADSAAAPGESWRGLSRGPSKERTPSEASWQLGEGEAQAASGGGGGAGTLWSGPIDVGSARLVQVRVPCEASPGATFFSEGTNFCLTEVEVSLYSGAKFVRLLEASVPDFVLLNKTSFPLFVAQHGVPAFEALLPVPRLEQRGSYESLTRYGLPFALYDPTKEKKIEVWRAPHPTASAVASPPQTSSASLTRRLSALPSRLRSAGSRRSSVLNSAVRGDAALKSGFPGGDEEGRVFGGGGSPWTAALRGIDSTAMRRIRREYAEALSLRPPQSDRRHGGGGLQRLVLATPGLGADGRVVVSVRRRVVKGSTFIVFFEASRGGAPPPSAAARFGVGPVYTIGGKVGDAFSHLDSRVEKRILKPVAGVGQQWLHDATEILPSEALAKVHLRGLQTAAAEGKAVRRRFEQLPLLDAGAAKERRRLQEGAASAKPPFVSSASDSEEEGALPDEAHSSPEEYDARAGEAREALLGDGSARLQSKLSSLSEPKAERQIKRGSLRASLASAKSLVGSAEASGSAVANAIETEAHKKPSQGAESGEAGPRGRLRSLGSRLPSSGLRLSNAFAGLSRLAVTTALGGAADAGVGSGEDSEGEELEVRPVFNSDLSLNFSLVGGGVSLIDSRPAEILYASLELLQVHYACSSTEGEKMKASIGWLQVDNHTANAYYPTMLRPISTAAKAAARPADAGEAQRGAKETLRGEAGAALGKKAAANSLGGSPVSHSPEPSPERSLLASPEDSQKGAFPNAGLQPRRQAVAAARSLNDESVDRARRSQDAAASLLIHQDRQRHAWDPRRRSSEVQLRAERAAEAHLLAFGSDEALAETAAADLHSEGAALRLLSEEDAVAQVLIERRLQLEGRGVIDVPRCVLRLEPLSINVDFQLAFAVLLFADDLLRTVDLDVLQQSVKDVRTSETDPSSAVWKTQLGPVEGILSEVLRQAGESSTKVFIGTLDVGRMMLVINIRNKRSGGESEEQQPQSELIRGVLALMKTSPYISDANLVFASEIQQNLCGPLVTLVGDIVQRYIGQAIKQVFQLLGAVDLFGNPVVVYKHWKGGALQCVSEVQKGLALWNTPGLACFTVGRGVALGGSAFVAGLLDSAGRFFGSWYQCFEAVARNTDAYSLMPELVSQGGLTDQPGSIAEGLVNGGRGFAFTLGLSLVNFCVKPVKATQQHMAATHPGGPASERYAAISKGVAVGVLSGLGSLCFGIPSSVFLLLSASCVGALNQIQAVPMLDSVRPRRIFEVGGWRSESYCLAASASQALLPRRSRSAQSTHHPHVLLAIPLYRGQDGSDGEDGLTEPPCERISRLEARIQKHAAIRLHQRRRKPRLLFCLGVKKIGVLDGKKLLWSCYRGDIAQLEIVEDRTPVTAAPGGARERGASLQFQSTFFLRIVFTVSEGRPPVDEGLARSVRAALRERQRKQQVASDSKSSSSSSDSSQHSTSSSSSSSSESAQSLSEASELSSSSSSSWEESDAETSGGILYAASLKPATTTPPQQPPPPPAAATSSSDPQGPAGGLHSEASGGSQTPRTNKRLRLPSFAVTAEFPTPPETIGAVSPPAAPAPERRVVATGDIRTSQVAKRSSQTLAGRQSFSVARSIGSGVVTADERSLLYQESAGEKPLPLSSRNFSLGLTSRVRILSKRFQTLVVQKTKRQRRSSVGRENGGFANCFAERWLVFPSEAAAFHAFNVLASLLDTAPGPSGFDASISALL